MKDIISQLYFFIRNKKINKDIVINTLDDINKLIDEITHNNVTNIQTANKIYRLWIPTEKVCMHGAFRYSGGWHPFISFLEKGVSELELFYKNFTPKNIAEMYSLREKEKGYNLPPWELPWIPRNIITKPADEGGLSSEKHGVSYFGPVSPEKLKYERERLITALESIKKMGYIPDKNNEINGFFMEYNNNFIFFVRGGKHRSAVLSFLNYKRIPVVLKNAWPPIIYSSDSSKWELVQSNDISESLALKVFKSYFDLNGKKQYKKINN
ncbi:MAG: hypothetical protein FWE72_00875 [Spirochaetaceae bacterium]|nr:hypothetical protein [Spirochaetaceae bacterium]